MFVCDDPAACSAFYDHLLDADAQLGRIIGRDMKTLFPDSTVVLVSTGVGMVAPSPGLDAVCYASCLDDEMASTLAMLFRNVFTRCPYENNDDLGELSN